MKDLVAKLTPNPHKKMERFAYTCVALCVCMMLTLVAGWVKYSNAASNVIETRSVYTTNFKMSKTGQGVQVKGIFTDTKKTKTFVLMKFSEPDQISTDAKKYKMYLTPANLVGNPMGMDATPSGGFYVFGSTGYVGAYIVNTEGFKPQVLDLVIRSNVELTQGAKEKSKDLDDNSFAQFDQGRVYFNPGATDTKVLPVLDDANPSIQDLYDQTVMNTQVEDLTKRMEAQLDKMRVDLNVISEYSERLDKTDGVQLPDMPPQIAGDRVDEVDGKLKLVTKTVLPGGFDFDWRTKPDTPYIDQLIAKSNTPKMSHDQFFAANSAKVQTSTSANGGAFDTKRSWTLKDGTKVSDLDTGTMSSRYSMINGDITKLTSAWSSYYTDKSMYQINMMTEYLTLEADSALVAQSASMNVDKGALVVY